MKEIYDWVPWFTKLAKKIADGGPAFLADRAGKVEWRNDDKLQPLLAYGEENIDPFSFLYTLANKSIAFSSRRIVYPSISNVFDLPELADDDSKHTFIFPTPDARFLLFHYRGNGNPKLLWRLFRQAVNGIESITDEDFDAALRMKGIAITKLTQAIFLVNPHEFLPLDDKLRPLRVTEWPKNPQWADYRIALGKFRESFPGCEPYEINLFAWLVFDKQLHVTPSQRFQVSTNVMGDGEDYWENFDEKNWVFSGGPVSGTYWDDYDQRVLQRGYPLQAPKPGNVVLVRYKKEPRGIGVVLKNEYQNGLSASHKLHVIWVNKRKSLTKLPNLPIIGFSSAGEKTVQAFRSVDAYGPTFLLLDRLNQEASSNGKQGNLREMDADSQATRPVAKHPRNQILYGPPGTGKTWSATSHALAIIDGVEVQNVKRNDERFRSLRFDLGSGGGQIAMVTFHQNFAYEDFVEGIRPRLKAEGELDYERHEGVFRRMARAAQERPDDPFVLIIDEINRGNIAKIFGELITLIEDSRRIGADDATYVTLPYSGHTFAVPNNLYIIGTMNTADRSIQLLDTALRRRFTFIEMMPEPEHELVSSDVDGVDCQKMLKAMNLRITALLDREHQIGHTYLFDVGGMDALAETFRNRIFPLLQEYFFDDWAKIRVVLRRNGFVQEQDIDPYVANSGMLDADNKDYQRLPDGDPKWHDPAQYQEIYETGEPQTEEAS